MPHNNEGRRRGSRKSGEFKTCQEGASFVLSETVHQAKKKGDKEEGGRPRNKAEVRQLRGEIRELRTKMRSQAEIIKLLQAALIGSMSRTMHDAYKKELKEEMKEEGYTRPKDVPADWKEEVMTKAKHEAIVKVADNMIYLTHLGSEKTFEPSNWQSKHSEEWSDSMTTGTRTWRTKRRRACTKMGSVCLVTVTSSIVANLTGSRP